jgi:electron transfer flavoprotein beta subunit
MAKRKPVAVLKPADLGVAVTATERPSASAPRPKRKAGQKVKTVEELFEKLTKEAKVL